MRSSACRTTSTDARAVSTAQNARVISSFRSARAASRSCAGRFGFCARRARERLQPAAGVDRPLQIDPRPHVVGNVRDRSRARRPTAFGTLNSSTWFVRV